MIGRSTQVLTLLNHLPLWRRGVSLDGGRLSAPSADRLLYLWLHRSVAQLRQERAYLQTLLRPGMAVAEIGANIGVYAHLFGRSVGASGRVLAFEPEPTLHAALEANMRSNGLAHVRTMRAAVGAESGAASLKVGLFNSGDNRLSQSKSHVSVREVETPVVCMDDVFKGERVDFVKIDVQGWEIQVLRGMRQVIEANPQIVIFAEFWPYGLTRAGYTGQELLDTVKSLGLSIDNEPGKATPDQLDIPALARRKFWFSNLLMRKARS